MAPTPKPVDPAERLDRLEAAVAQLASDFYSVNGAAFRHAAVRNHALMGLMAAYRREPIGVMPG